MELAITNFLSHISKTNQRKSFMFCIYAITLKQYYKR